MHLKIRCDGESEKIYKIFWELNNAQDSNGGGAAKMPAPLHIHMAANALSLAHPIFMS